MYIQDLYTVMKVMQISQVFQSLSMKSFYSMRDRHFREAYEKYADKRVIEQVIDLFHENRDYVLTICSLKARKKSFLKYENVFFFC